MSSLLDQGMAERRERILEAARAAIESRGYAGLTMRELARESGVTVPTIYNLVGSKDEVLLAAVEEQTGDFVAGLERARGDLLAVVDACVRELQRRPRYYRTLLLVLFDSDAAGPARRHVEHAMADQIDRALAELDDGGALAPWIDTVVLGERLHSHLAMTSIEWAKGALTAAGFREAARYEAATTMIGVTHGHAREAFEKAARESQAGARMRRDRRSSG